MNANERKSTKRKLSNDVNNNNNNNKKLKINIARDLFDCLNNNYSLFNSVNHIIKKYNISCANEKDKYFETFFNPQTTKNRKEGKSRTLKQLTEFIKSEKNNNIDGVAFDVNQSCKIIENFAKEILNINMSSNKFLELPKNHTNLFNYVCENIYEIFKTSDDIVKLSILIKNTFSLKNIGKLIFENNIKNCYDTKYSFICESFDRLLVWCKRDTQFYFFNSKYTLKLICKILELREFNECRGYQVIKFILKYYNGPFNFIGKCGLSILAISLVISYIPNYFSVDNGYLEPINILLKNKGAKYMRDDYDIICNTILSQSAIANRYSNIFRNEIDNVGIYKPKKVDYLKNLIISYIDENNISTQNLPYLLFVKKK